MPNPTNPFGPVVSATVSAFTLVALVLALGVLAAGLRDAILNDWADDVPDPLDELDDAPDDEPRRVVRFEGEAARRWLEVHGYTSHGLVWPPSDPELWRPDSPEDVRP